MIHIEKHKLVDVAVYMSIVAFEWHTGGKDNGIAVAMVLGLFLLIILFSKIFAFFGSFGFKESFASDYGDGISPSSVAFLG